VAVFQVGEKLRKAAEKAKEQTKECFGEIDMAIDFTAPEYIPYYY